MAMNPRDDSDEVHTYVSPFVEMNAGLWSLFAAASAFLALRIWVKTSRSYRLWYDDYILIFCWGLLLANNSLIVHEFATGYILKDSTHKWDDRMHILINISSCGTLIGQALTKTAFAVTLLRLGNRWQRWLLWFCIITMNLFMAFKVIFQWAKVCGKPSYQNWYRLDFCIDWKFRDEFKEAGNIYNIIMDFLFASIPWLITRPLQMRRVEKIGLCVTMSLGMIVAIVSAIRVSWKDQGNDSDRYYIYRNGVSQVWYSSEVAGTIIVQCIPVLRSVLRKMHPSWPSMVRSSTSSGPRVSWTRFLAKRSSTATAGKDVRQYNKVGKAGPSDTWKYEQEGDDFADSSPSTEHDEIVSCHSTDMWPLAPPKTLQIYTTKSFSTEWDTRETSCPNGDRQGSSGKAWA